MIQCKDCEFYELGPEGQRTFKCDPFGNIKEPECLVKWQLLRLDVLVAAHQGLLSWYQRMAPMQDKIFKYVQREINDTDETERWKVPDEDDDEPDQDEYL
jgi:hypothetical protein